MKNALFTAFKILIFLVLIGKVLNWFLNFSDQINQLLNVAMFTLIGIAYLVMGYTWDHKLVKIIIMTCGVFLVAMNFFSNHVLLDITGVICILAPMLMERFFKDKRDKMKVAES